MSFSFRMTTYLENSPTKVRLHRPIVVARKLGVIGLPVGEIEKRRYDNVLVHVEVWMVTHLIFFFFL